MFSAHNAPSSDMPSSNGRFIVHESVLRKIEKA
jgi:hypothetical protein